MTYQVNIFKKGTTDKIGSFVTSAKDIQKAFYKHFKGLYTYGDVCATDCYYKLSDV